MKKISLLTLITFSLNCPPIMGQVSKSPKTTISILPISGPNMSDVVVDSKLALTRDSGTSYLDIYISCFGTNLRGVSNPVSPDSTIHAAIEYLSSDNTYKTYKVSFPALAVVRNSRLSQNLTGQSGIVSSDGTLTTKFTARLEDGLIRVAMINTRSIGLDVLASGTDFGKLNQINSKAKLFRAVRFNQELPPNAKTGKYMGASGPLTANIRWYHAENGKSTVLYASFPGETGFCGGYFSPLVLNFSDDLPQVSNTSFFPLYQNQLATKKKEKIFWPTFSKNLFFLGYDRNENRKIDHGGELFGDINGYENGFQNLSFYDSNKDGVIDKNDPIYSQLLLWQDKNQDGISQRLEVYRLDDLGVQSLSLEYRKETRNLAHRAKLLGPGSFTYIDKEGTKKSGAVWDIFLTRAP